MLQILFIIFGFIALTKNEFTVIGKRKVSGSNATLLGVIMLIGGIGGFFIPLAMIIACPSVLIIGLAVARQQPDEAYGEYGKPKNDFEKPKNTFE